MSSHKPRRSRHQSKRASSRKFPAYLIHDPPADLPDELKSVYMFAARPHLLMENLCVLYEVQRATDSLSEFSTWALGLLNGCRELRRWLNGHEGKLRAEADDVRLALEAMNQTLWAAVSDISYAITMLTGTALDPDDPQLDGLAHQLQLDSKLQTEAKKLRDKDAKRSKILKDCTLSKARESRSILERLRSGLSAWAMRMPRLLGPEKEPKRGRGRRRDPQVDEVQAFIYKRWMKGEKLARIRAAAATQFGTQRSPKEDAHVTREALRYAKKHSLPTNRQA